MVTRTTALGAVPAAGGVACVAAWWLLGTRRPRPVPPPTGRSTQVRAVVDGRRRSWNVYRPNGIRPDAPVVLALHGSGENGNQFRRATGRRFDQLADRHGFVVVYPDGWRRNWNEPRLAGRFAAKKRAVDDTRFLAHVLDDAAPAASAALVTGYSSGGAMALRFALEASDRVTAIAPVGASVPAPDNWQPDVQIPARLPSPTAALLILGDADPVNPITGGDVGLCNGAVGNRGRVLSAADSVRWLDDHGFNAEGLTIPGNGHHYTVPGRRGPRLFGPTAPNVDIAATVIDYFLPMTSAYAETVDAVET